MKKGVEVQGIFIAEKRYDLLQNVVNHLIESGFQTKEGLKIEDDEAFKNLQKTAEDQVKQPYFILHFDKYPHVGLLHGGLLDHVPAFWENIPWFLRKYWMFHIKRINKSIHTIHRIDKMWTLKALPILKEMESKNT